MNDHDRIAKLAESILRKGQGPRRNPRVQGPIIRPGDKGFKDDVYYPWTFIGGLAGFPQKDISVEIHGWVVMDRRSHPHRMIFKDCVIPMITGFKPPLDNQPVPFESLQEAMMFVDKMHLSLEQKEFVSVTALSPDPGMGRPKPDTLFVPKQELKKY
jgi:hypothetical protein